MAIILQDFVGEKFYCSDYGTDATVLLNSVTLHHHHTVIL